jgi:hypothetical protein
VGLKSVAAKESVTRRRGGGGRRTHPVLYLYLTATLSLGLSFSSSPSFPLPPQLLEFQLLRPSPAHRLLCGYFVFLLFLPVAALLSCLCRFPSRNSLLCSLPFGFVGLRVSLQFTSSHQVVIARTPSLNLTSTILSCRESNRTGTLLLLLILPPVYLPPGAPSRRVLEVCPLRRLRLVSSSGKPVCSFATPLTSRSLARRVPVLTNRSLVLCPSLCRRFDYLLARSLL